MRCNKCAENQLMYELHEDNIIFTAHSVVIHYRCSNGHMFIEQMSKEEHDNLLLRAKK